MLIHRTGDILMSDTDALVNPVNTVGVMGAGLALRFRHRFPDNYREYRDACGDGRVCVGRVFVHEFRNLSGKRWIINFPTKDHWQEHSRYAWIETGLADMTRRMRELGITSVSLPRLGCGLGGLSWSRVEPMIVTAFGGMDDVIAVIYEHGR